MSDYIVHRGDFIEINSSTIVKVAKAIALDKIDKLKEQTDKLQEMIDEFA